MNPKCRYCKKEVDRKTAYKVVVFGKNHYYCNQEEYQEEEKMLNKIYEVMKDTSEVTKNDALRKIKTVVASLEDKYSLQQIYDYLKYDSERIHRILYSKSFGDEAGKISYYAAIIRNSIVEYINVIQKRIEQQRRPVEIDYYEVPVKYKPKKIRRPMVEIEKMGDYDEE